MTWRWSEILQSPPLRLSGELANGYGGVPRSLSYGEGFSELAMYRDGDPIQRLHLPSLLNRGDLVSRRYELPHRAALCLFFDETGSMGTGAYGQVSREIGARLAAGALNAGHRVRLLVERDAALIESEWLRRSDELIWWWERLFSTPPSGESLCLSKRRAALLTIPNNASLVYLSDGVSETLQEVSAQEVSETLQEVSVQEVSETFRLISAAEQLSGALGRLRRICYLCLVDPTAERSILNEPLRSPENSGRPLLKPLRDYELQDALSALRSHREAQRDSLAHIPRVSWGERATHDATSKHIEWVTRQLS